MSSLLVIGELDDILLNAELQKLLLLRHVCHLDDSLHGMGAFLVAGDVDKSGLDGLQDLQSLVAGGALEEFRAKEVPVLVNHQVGEAGKCLLHNEFNELRGGSVEQFLEILRSLLAFCLVHYLACPLVDEGLGVVLVLAVSYKGASLHRLVGDLAA